VASHDWRESSPLGECHVALCLWEAPNPSLPCKLGFLPNLVLKLGFLPQVVLSLSLKVSFWSFQSLTQFQGPKRNPTLRGPKYKAQNKFYTIIYNFYK